jgi:hypothetical protein
MLSDMDLSTRLQNADRLRIDFLPDSLKSQCRALIESYHSIHGYACLPNMLWRTGLGHFIEINKDFQHLLRKASTTRSAKKSNEGFVAIATAILSSEILASDFSGWSKMFPDARPLANSILSCRAANSYTSLMDEYLYPRKNIDPAVVATLMPRVGRETNAAGLSRTSGAYASAEQA